MIYSPPPLLTDVSIQIRLSGHRAPDGLTLVTTRFSWTVKSCSLLDNGDSTERLKLAMRTRKKPINVKSNAPERRAKIIIANNNKVASNEDIRSGTIRCTNETRRGYQIRDDEVYWMRRDEDIRSGTVRYMNETRRGYPIRDDEVHEWVATRISYQGRWDILNETRTGYRIADDEVHEWEATKISDQGWLGRWMRRSEDIRSGTMR
jgi:hypothetical protein